jgi:hypothetical protein
LSQVNYCPKVHKPHFCSHGFGENSLGEKGENKGKKDAYSPIPQGDSPENSPNSPIPQGDSPIPQGENSPREIPSLVAIPPRGKRIRKIPPRGKIGEKASHEDKSVSKDSSWTGHLLFVGGLGLLAVIIFLGLKASRSNDSTNNSGTNSSSPPPSSPPSSNPYDFGGMNDFGVKSLDQLARYNV